MLLLIVRQKFVLFIRYGRLRSFSNPLLQLIPKVRNDNTSNCPSDTITSYHPCNSLESSRQSFLRWTSKSRNQRNKGSQSVIVGITGGWPIKSILLFLWCCKQVQIQRGCRCMRTFIGLPFTWLPNRVRPARSGACSLVPTITLNEAYIRIKDQGFI